MTGSWECLACGQRAHTGLEGLYCSSCLDRRRMALAERQTAREIAAQNRRAELERRELELAGQLSIEGLGR